MDSSKLSVWVLISFLAAAITMPSVVYGDEHAYGLEGGARRPETPMTEVIVVGSQDQTGIIEFQNSPSNIILVHEYDEKSNEWKLVGLRDLRRGTTKTITH